MRITVCRDLSPDSNTHRLILVAESQAESYQINHLYDDLTDLGITPVPPATEDVGEWGKTKLIIPFKVKVK